MSLAPVYPSWPAVLVVDPPPLLGRAMDLEQLNNAGTSTSSGGTSSRAGFESFEAGIAHPLTL